MPNTPIFGWPYQALTDAPDGAALGEDLALAIEATLNTPSPVISYTPELTAPTTNPTDYVSFGRYLIVFGLIFYQFRVQFSAGMTPGSGEYHVSVPRVPLRLTNSSVFGNSDVVGVGAIRDNSVTADNRAVLYSFPATGVGEFLQMHVTATATLVTHNSPFAWAPSDGIVGTVLYVPDV